MTLFHRHAKLFGRFFSTTLMLFYFLLESSKAYGIPGLQEQWQFLCATPKVSDTALMAAEKEANKVGDNLPIALAMQQYACLLRAKELRTYEHKMTVFNRKGQKGQAPKEDLSLSTEFIKSSNARFNDALQGNKKEEIEKILYHYGLGLALMKNPLAVNMFDKLMTEYKGSSFLGKAYLGLGAYYLDRQEVENAKREFLRAKQHKDPLVSGYANYQLIWLDFAIALSNNKVQEQRKAMNMLASIAQESNNKKGKNKKLTFMIAKDLEQMLVAVGTPDDIVTIMGRINKKYKIPILLNDLAMNQLNQGNAQKAYNTIELALRKGPVNLRSLDLSITQTQIAAQMNNLKLVSNNIIRAVNIYKPKSKWYEKQKPKIQKIAEQKLEQFVFNYATMLDQQGTSEKNKQYLGASERYYQIFLKEFPKSKNTYQAKYFYGQLLFQLQKFIPAAELLMDLISKEPKGKFTKDAADVMVTAAQSAIDSDPNKYTLPEAGKIKKKIKLPRTKKLYANALDVYLKHIPKNENTLAMHFAVGSVYYEFGDYLEAQKRLFTVIKMDPKNDFAATASYQLLFAFNNLKDKKRFIETRNLVGKYENLKVNQDIAPFFKINFVSANKSNSKVNARKEDTGIEEGNANEPKNGENLDDPLKNEDQNTEEKAESN